MSRGDLKLDEATIERVALVGVGTWKLYVRVSDVAFTGYFDSLFGLTTAVADCATFFLKHMAKRGFREH